MLLALALQAAGAPGTPPVPPPPPQRFSILAPDCPTDKAGGDIVVCARPGDGSPRLPLPDERPHVSPLMIPGAAERMVDNRPRPAGPEPCAASQEGCTVGFGADLIAVAKGIGRLVRTATAPKPDRSRRVAIRLDDLSATPAPAPVMR